MSCDHYSNTLRSNLLPYSAAASPDPFWKLVFLCFWLICCSVSLNLYILFVVLVSSLCSFFCFYLYFVHMLVVGDCWVVVFFFGYYFKVISGFCLGSFLLSFLYCLVAWLMCVDSVALDRLCEENWFRGWSDFCCCVRFREALVNYST